MRGMSNTTGKALDDVEHILQSVADILSTPVGSRVARRDYGSLIFELIDKPLNAGTSINISAASIEAIDKWEPRVKCIEAPARAVTTSGRVTVLLKLRRISTGEILTTEVTL
jgi:phage baseplate assembly protein W